MGAYNKFIVALLMMAGNGIRSHYGVDLGVDEAMATSLAGGITAALVWLVPNR
ncbi:hypothetical protein [Hoeflea sp.]|uniref:hypothetical protein n=1 Tax=Hoeflea sp. TaxID=1940281 RepID=UPI003B02A14A